MKALGWVKDNISITVANELRNGSGNLNFYRVLRDGFSDVTVPGNEANFILYFYPCPTDS